MELRGSSWQQAQQILEFLSSLSYRVDELDHYLFKIACGVSQLLNLDWSVVTLCWDGKDKVMASSIDMGEGEHIYSLHGSLTNTVVNTGQTLTVDDAMAHPEYGSPPKGYISYLGVPLRTPQGKVIGTICSFCHQPRHFISEEIKTAELFAERAATAIDNYNLYQQERRFHELLEIEVIKRTEELHLAQMKLIEQERLAAIGEFASMIVHEIRNPVTTILMGLDHFKRTHLSERDQMRASLALEEAQRLQNLLSEILLYAKPHILQGEELELNEWVAKMLESLQEMPEASGRVIKLIPSRKKCKIIGDKDKLKQVLINLIRNACEAIPSEEVVTFTLDKPTKSRQVFLKIHNRGTPIPTNFLPKLTQPFCSTKPGGTGLGLAIVKRIVEAHGGTLLIESDATQGTTVQIQLPLKTNS